MYDVRAAVLSFHTNSVAAKWLANAGEYFPESLKNILKQNRKVCEKGNEKKRGPLWLICCYCYCSCCWLAVHE